MTALVDAGQVLWRRYVMSVGRCEDANRAKTIAFLAKQLKVGLGSVKRRFDAIDYQLALGRTADEIIAMGQEMVMSAAEKSRRERQYEKTVQMRFDIPGSLREVIRTDFSYMCEQLDIHTSEMLWDFLHSVFTGWGPEELKALAGAYKRDKEEPGSRG